MWVTINSVTNIIKYTGESKKRALFLTGKRGGKYVLTFNRDKLEHTMKREVKRQTQAHLWQG